MKAGDILRNPDHVEIYKYFGTGYTNTNPTKMNNIYVCYTCGSKEQIANSHTASYGCCNDDVSSYTVYRLTK